MLLAIDIGNTSIVIGVFEGESLLSSWRLSTRADRTHDEYGIMIIDLLTVNELKAGVIGGIIISSVVPPLSHVFEELSLKYFDRGPMIVSSELDTGIKILYKKPEEVGADRIVNAAAAYHLYGGPIIIVDFGTATTFCFVTSRGEYLGGVISPGIEISANALFERTAKLPRVDLSRPSKIIGDNTVTAMQAGLIIGHAGLVDRMVEEIKRETGENPYVVATGGLAGLIAPESRTIKEVMPSLTLEGLRIIYNRNI
jgi:type III pantothenate kinase